MRRFIVIEGLIGVGKTTLCRLLEQKHSAELFLEPHADNPFLEPFYNDQKRYALPVQMYYLLTRFKQQDSIRQMSLFHEWIVSDYLFQKDRLFAEKTLAPDELELYDRFVGTLGPVIPTPDLVIHLSSPIDALLARIRKRGVAGEEHITRAYLEDLKARYDAMFSNWTACPVLHIDNSALEYHADPAAQKQVLALIEEALGGDRRASAPGSEDREAQPELFG